MIFTIIFLLQWFARINGQSYYTMCGSYSGTHYSDAFLSGAQAKGTYSGTHYSDAFLSGAQAKGTHSGTYSGTHYSDAFLSRAQCILSNLHPKSSSNTQTHSHIAISNKDKQYISYIGSNNFVSISKNVFSYLSISKYYNSHITGTSKHERYISYIGSSNIDSVSKNKYSYFSSTPVPTVKPTFKPTPLSTVKPTPSLVPIISFDTKISFSNYNSLELDPQNQNAVIVATSISMNISTSFVKYIGTSLQARRILKLLFFKTQGYNIIVLLQTTIPLSGTFAEYKTNPTQLFSSLTAKISNSVSSGDFAQYLQANSPSFANITILSVENDNYVIVEPRPKKKDDFKTDVLSIIYVILFSICVVIIIKIGYMIRRCVKSRQIQEPIYSNQI